MKTLTVLLIGLVLVAVGIVSLPLLMHRMMEERIGPQHVFKLAEHPESLTEEFAIAKAQETLPLDGLDPQLWLLATNGCTINSNRAVVMFYTRGPAAPRLVSVQLDGDRLVCQISIAK